MIKFTESQIFQNQLYGTNQTISPQNRMTYDIEGVTQLQSQLKLNQSESDNNEEQQLRSQKFKKTNNQNNPLIIPPSSIIYTQLDDNIKETLMNDRSFLPSKIDEFQLNIRKSENPEQIIQILKKQNELKEAQISQLKLKLQTYKSNLSFLKVRQVQPTGSEDNMESVGMSKKLSQYQRRVLQLQIENKELRQRVRQTKKKLEAQFEDLYKCQINNLQSQLRFERQRFEIERTELLSKLQQKEKTLKKIQNVKLNESKKHKCDVCREYQLLQSEQKLKRKFQQAVQQIQQLKYALRSSIKENEVLRNAIQMIKSLNQARD